MGKINSYHSGLKRSKHWNRCCGMYKVHYMDCKSYKAPKQNYKLRNSYEEKETEIEF